MKERNFKNNWIMEMITGDFVTCQSVTKCHYKCSNCWTWRLFDKALDVLHTSPPGMSSVINEMTRWSTNCLGYEMSQRNRYLQTKIKRKIHALNWRFWTSCSNQEKPIFPLWGEMLSTTCRWVADTKLVSIPCPADHTLVDTKDICNMMLYWPTFKHAYVSA